MDKDKKYDERDHQEENKRTSPTDIKGKDLDNANATNSGAGSHPIEEAPNQALNNENIEEPTDIDKQNPEKITNKEHDTKQDQTRYQGSKNSSGMDTDLSQTERNKNSNRDDLENTQDKTRGL